MSHDHGPKRLNARGDRPCSGGSLIAILQEDQVPAKHDQPRKLPKIFGSGWDLHERGLADDAFRDELEEHPLFIVLEGNSALPKTGGHEQLAPALERERAAVTPRGLAEGSDVTIRVAHPHGHPWPPESDAFHRPAAICAFAGCERAPPAPKFQRSQELVAKSELIDHLERLRL